MDNRREQKDSGDREKVGGLGAHLTFYGYMHVGGNTEAVPRILTAFEQFTRLPYGERVFYQETTDLSDSNAPQFTNAANRGKLADLKVDIDWRGRVGKVPDSWALRARVGRIEGILGSGDNDPLGRIVRERLLGYEDLQGYLIWRGLDKVRETTPFTMAFEQHPDIESRIIGRMMDKVEEDGILMEKTWGERNFEGAVRISRSRKALLSEIHGRRVKDVVDDLKGRLRRMSRATIGGSVFTLFGGYHSSDIERLRGELNRFDRVTFDIRQDESSTNRTEGNGLPSDDLSIGQRMFEDLLMQAVRDTSLKKGKLTGFCSNWGAAEALCARVASSYDLRQIKDFCQRGITSINVLSEIGNNPLASGLGNFVR